MPYLKGVAASQLHTVIARRTEFAVFKEKKNGLYVFYVSLLIVMP